MSDAPDSFWDTDLLERGITDEEEAQQVLLFSLQAHPDICETELQERFLESRSASQAHLRIIKNRELGILLDADAYESDLWSYDGQRSIESDDIARILNALPLPHRRALAELLRIDEDTYLLEITSEIRKNRMMAQLGLNLDDMLLERQTSQAESVAALMLGEL
jgi:hypothetical protein